MIIATTNQSSTSLKLQEIPPNDPFRRARDEADVYQTNFLHLAGFGQEEKENKPGRLAIKIRQTEFLGIRDNNIIIHHNYHSLNLNSQVRPEHHMVLSQPPYYYKDEEPASD